jgi:hypothetical protein
VHRPGTAGRPASVFTVTITLREITEDNAQSVLALRCRPDQERFVSSVTDSLAEAAEYPQTNPWFRAVYAGEPPVGFVMLSWNVEPSAAGDHRPMVPLETPHRPPASGQGLRP